MNTKSQQSPKEIVAELGTKVRNDHVLVAPGIPDAKLTNACSHIAPGAQPLEVLLIVDETQSGNAAAGLLLTSKCMYVKTPLAKAKSIELCDVKKVTLLDYKFFGCTLQINGGSISTTMRMVPGANRESVTRLIAKCAQTASPTNAIDVAIKRQTAQVALALVLICGFGVLLFQLVNPFPGKVQNGVNNQPAPIAEVLATCPGISFESMYSSYLSRYKGSMSAPLFSREDFESAFNGNEKAVLNPLISRTVREGVFAQVNGDIASQNSWVEGTNFAPTDIVHAYYFVFNMDYNKSLDLEAVLDSSTCFVQSITFRSADLPTFLLNSDPALEAISSSKKIAGSIEFGDVFKLIGHNLAHVEPLSPIMKTTRSLRITMGQNKNGDYYVIIMRKP